MGLFQGEAPPNVETFRETAQKAPDYLTNYLSQLATSGLSSLGTTTGTGESAVFTPKTGTELIAGMDEKGLEQAALTAAPTTLTRYQDALDEALKAGQAASGGIDTADISKFYDPYQKQVVDELGRQSALNVQRGLLPMLRGAFASQGGFGGQRYAGALGQTLGDVQANLLGKQSEVMSAGYKQALDAALREQQAQVGATSALASLGGQEAQAGTSTLKSMAELGGIERGLRQAEIDAPLTRAQNVAQIMRGYSYPTTTTETYKGPASAYGPSALQQIAGLGTLIGAAYPSGGGGFGTKIEDLIAKIFGGGSGNVTIGDPGLPDEVKDILGPPT
jgi:hypothetical protein